MNKSVAIIGTRGYPSYYSGFETAVRYLSPYLADNGWAVTVYSRPGATKEADPTADHRIRSQMTFGIESRSLSTLSFGLTAAFAASRLRPSVALVMNVANGYWLPLLKARKIPTVVNVDGIEWEREKWSAPAKAVFKGGAGLTARLADQLIYDSTALSERWMSDFGVSGNFIPYGGERQPELPLTDGLRHRGYVLFVARFVPENTVHEFLAAARLLAHRHDVVIVGSSGYGGQLDDAVRGLADAHIGVRWLGHISDDRRLASLWQHAGAYFHGHSVGGTNPSLVQAMACGAPTVARDTVYNREVLGNSGVFVQPEAPQIVAAIEGLLRDVAVSEQLGQRARERAAEHYTWPQVCSDYERLLSDVADRGSGRWGITRRARAQQAIQ